MISTNKMALNSKVTQSMGNIASDMDGEKVMMSVNNGKYYNLGEMGGIIWDRINKPIMIKDLVLTLASEYDVEPGQCEEEVLSFLSMLYKEGLVQLEE